MVLFWGKGTIYSNWFLCPIECFGANFNCSEQLFMYQKAMHFDDATTAQKILMVLEPRDQKALGRKIKNFNEAEWVSVRESKMRIACFNKFVQNAELLKQLIGTGDRIIVEASPVDAIWGIGLHETDPLALDQKTWQGLNLLGKILMEVREELR